MAINFNDPIAHDPEEIKSILEKMQGNILKGHGRDNTVNIFVRFSETDLEALRAGLISAAGGLVTDGWTQLEERKAFKENGTPGDLFGNFFLSRKGYRKLGFPGIGNLLTDSHFIGGMAADTANLKDPSSNQWEQGYDGGDIDAMFLLADDDIGRLEARRATLEAEISGFCDILVTEKGIGLRDPVTNAGIEHFGYVDGRSQPIYLSIDMPAEGTTHNWNPLEPLKIVLVKDRTVPGEDNFGSYMVYRKLEQNVRDFRKREDDLAAALNLQGADAPRAGAMAVGKFRDGTPLVLQQTDGRVPAGDNDFTYAGDDGANGGSKCPYHAHIRKSNPRGDSVRKFGVSDRSERDHRITRRGIPFGEANEADLPTGGVGLLFMCFQSNIANQFVFMQSSWVNNQGFVNGDTGIDPVAGQSTGGLFDQKWQATWGPPKDPNPTRSLFEGFVKMKGGEYFFAPCMEFLKSFTPA